MTIGTAELVGDRYTIPAGKHCSYSVNCAGRVYKLIPNWRPTAQHVLGYSHVAITGEDGKNRTIKPLDENKNLIDWEIPFDDETALAALGYRLQI